MKFCDITMAYNATSGGIKTYIEEKRRFLRDNTDCDHLLIIPGARDRVRRSGRTTTVTIRSPLLPGQDAYRFFLSPAKIKQVLIEEAPEIVELGTITPSRGPRSGIAGASARRALTACLGPFSIPMSRRPMSPRRCARPHTTGSRM
jgi:alpha-1,6-mannosyltransferase